MYSSKFFHTAPALNANVVTVGNIRIQFITECLVRLEWQENGKFEDRQTLAVINRDLGAVKFTHQQKKEHHILRTAKLLIELDNDHSQFSSDNLKITFIMNDKKVTWKPGQSAAGNLGGTIRTLDMADGGYRMVPSDQTGMRPARQIYEYQPLDLGQGFISRDGWSVIDDSSNAAVDKVKGYKWAAQRHGGQGQDWYFFGYGHDYITALADAAQVFGRQPLPPRYTLGYWWSRYWAYSDIELEGLVHDFENNKLPLDVMVIDTDWHLPGWTGYSWDRAYFPDPDEHLQWLHQRGIRVSLNLHPNEGVGRHEDQFPAMCKAMGLDSRKTDSIPFDFTDPVYMDSYFKILHQPEEQRGVDFWWMDWHERETDRMPGLDPLCWVNQLHWEDMESRGGNRPLIFSRFGGYGSGRYNIGFSGDTHSTWESLAYQPYFTATAANILFGYWSHDIGGHHLHGQANPELYTRWIQYGVFSPILRSHCNKNPNAERRVWKYPDPYSKIMEDALRLRRRLTPYIYSENHKAFDRAISLCRPMYYHWPEEENAYKYQQQYMFGSEMLAAPIVSPRDPQSEMVEIKVWLPEGEWFDTARGCREKGGRVITGSYLLNEIPIFVRPGTIIPELQNGTRLDERCYHKLALSVYPGGSGSYELYEDDGISSAYLREEYAVIAMFQEIEGNVQTIRVIRQSGNFDGYEAERSLEVRLEGSVPPVTLKAGNRRLDYVFRLDEAEEGWSYDGRRSAVMIKVKSFNLDRGIVIKAFYSDADSCSQADGLRGIFNRLEQVRELGISLCYWQSLHPEERLTQEIFSTANRLSRRPETFKAEMDKFHRDLCHLPAVVEKHMRLGADTGIPFGRLNDGNRILHLIKEINNMMAVVSSIKRR